MVAYSFKTSFAAKIISGEKQQTIRLPRKRHARPGEEVQLYTAMRTKHCRLIGRGVVQAVHDVRLDFLEDRVTLDGAADIDEQAALDAFAIRDGFSLPLSLAGNSAWSHMKRWWLLTHGDIDVFQGVVIDWGQTLRAA